METLKKRSTELYEEAKAKHDDEKAELLNRTPGENLTIALGFVNGSPLSELNETESGTYYSDDFSTITLVRSCTRDLESSGTTVSFGGLASAELGIMTDGTVLVLDSSVVGFETDMSGNWIAD